jgi:hypothetical protein
MRAFRGLPRGFDGRTFRLLSALHNRGNSRAASPLLCRGITGRRTGGVRWPAMSEASESAGEAGRNTVSESRPSHVQVANLRGAAGSGRRDETGE